MLRMRVDTFVCANGGKVCDLDVTWRSSKARYFKKVHGTSSTPKGT